ncbi:MAG: DUF2071 domain-containing protein [bacterium]|nr:DUF2071 domain-containing protein [Candidatus Kapabacteria bacterium]
MSEPVDLLNAQWRNIVMLNYIVEPVVFARYLPDGLELDTHHDRHFLSVIGQMVQDVHVAGVSDPLHKEFEQVSLRFYVKRPLAAGGFNRGVVYIKQVVPDALPVVAARAIYNESFVQMPMRHEIWPPGAGAKAIGMFDYYFAQDDEPNATWHRIHAATHDASRNMQIDSKEEFLTDRGWGYSGGPGITTLEYRIEHAKWRYFPATHSKLECDVMQVFGREFVPYINGSPDLAFVAEGSEIAIHLPHGLDQIP